MGLRFMGIGLVVYLLIYLSMPEPKIFMSVDESGRTLAVDGNDVGTRD